MCNILNRKNSIYILFVLMYQPGRIEFLSELIKKIKIINKDIDSKETLRITKEYLNFLTTKKVIFIKCGKGIYDISNIELFFNYLDNNFDDFINLNNSNYLTNWYSYMLEYTEEWKNNLKKLNLIKGKTNHNEK